MQTIRKFGCIPDPIDIRDVTYAASKPLGFSRTGDLRWNELILSVRDQGPAGTCTGYGSTGVCYASMRADKTFKTPAFHPSELFPYFNGRANKLEDTGASIRDVVKATATFGLAPYETWVYDVKNVCIKPPQRAYDQALKFKSIKYARVPQTERDMVNVLASGFAIVFGHTCRENFWKVGKDGMVPIPLGREEGGHCEYIMGYDMNKQLFTVQNSWGLDRADHGYEYFKFDHLLNPDHARDFWVIYEVSI